MDILERFLLSAAERPSAAAVQETHRSYTYGELKKLAESVNYLASRVSCSPRVMIVLKPGASAYASMLGTLMAGGFYCPLDTILPTARKAAIARQFEPHLIICEDESLDESTFRSIELPDDSVRPLVVTPRVLTERDSTVRPPHELAYVIFTSGSTGVPKGVMVRRAAVASLVGWALQATEVTSADRWAQFSSLGFDLSVMDIYTCLAGGATLVPFADRIGRLMPAKTIHKHQITIWHSVPSVVDLMNSAGHLDPDMLSSLRLASFCGETLLASQVELLLRACPTLTIFNTYGPTEITVLCTCHPMTAETVSDLTGPSIPLGDVLPGWRIDLLGGRNADEGEIVVSGDNIAAGYWRNEAATEAAYRRLALADSSGPQWAYFTGDWAQRRDGQLYFCHRLDRQVKFRGHRLELGEIDASLRQVGATASVTTLHGGELVSFVVTSADLTEQHFRDRLRELLPVYAVPGRIVLSEHLPRNANDKVDVNALLAAI